MDKIKMPLLSRAHEVDETLNLLYTPVDIRFVITPELTMLLVWGLYATVSLVIYYLGVNVR